MCLHFQEISTNKQINVLSNITLRSAREKVEAGFDKVKFKSFIC